MRIFVLIFAVVFTSTVFSFQLPSDKVLSIPLNNWTSQRVLSLAIGEFIAQSGTKVEYVNISSDDQWGALGRGSVHFQLEVWEPSMKQHLQTYLSKGSVVDMGPHQAKVIEDWWYPKYVERLCPRLPDWRALISCKHLFQKDNGVSTKAVYYGGPWDYGDADLIRALGLEFSIVRMPTDKELWRQLDKSVKDETPILLLNWSPNWTDNHIPGEFVNFPKYTESCESEPGWGLNKTLLKDCGNKRQGWLKKVGSKYFKRDFSCAYDFVQAIQFTKKMIADAASLVVVDKLTAQQAAKAWSHNYRENLKQWAAATCLPKNIG